MNACIVLVTANSPSVAPHHRVSACVLATEQRGSQRACGHVIYPYRAYQAGWADWGSAPGELHPA